MSAKTVKMCDLNGAVAAKVFESLNYGKVTYDKNGRFGPVLITDMEPMDLTYPEGWYYAKGCFRNKHQSTTGIYSEVPMMKRNGKQWDAAYCTLY